jgi:hypothetical protein
MPRIEIQPGADPTICVNKWIPDPPFEEIDLTPVEKEDDEEELDFLTSKTEKKGKKK